jgi:hypothetical protein
MASYTATIQRQEFAAAWDAGDRIIAIASRYTITRAQVDRLRMIWRLRPRRHGTVKEPCEDEAATWADNEASMASCDSAPSVLFRIEELQKAGVIRRKNVALSPVVFSVRVFDDEDDADEDDADGDVADEGVADADVADE